MPDNEFKAKTYRNLKTAYGDDYTLSEEEFNTKFDSDSAFVSKTYRNLKTAYGDDYTVTEEDFKKKVPTTKPTKPASQVGGEDSSVGAEKTQPISGSGDSQPTYSVKPDESPSRKGVTTKVTVGGKEFDTPIQPELTSTEVKSTAQKLFKIASPIVTKPPPTFPKSPAMEGIVKETGEVALDNLSPKATSGNEDILTEYISTLPEDEQNRLRGKKFTEEESLEILNNAYRPRLEQAVTDLSILRERGVEDELKVLDEKQKQINSLTQSVNADKTALVNLQATFLKQKGYDKISSDYQAINKQLQSKQKEIAPVFEAKSQLETELEAFAPLIQEGQFTGNKQEYDAYQALYSEYQKLIENPKLAEFNSLVAKQNDIAKSINSMVTPEYKEQEEKLMSKMNTDIASIKGLSESVGEAMTPEKEQNFAMYDEALNDYNRITNSLQTAKSKMPEVIEKEQYVDAINRMKDVNGALRGYNLASIAFGSITDAAGSLLSAPAKFVGGMDNEYTFSDKAAESIADFFAPALTSSNTLTAGQPSRYKKDFYEAETDAINWEALPEEVASQVGSFALLAGTGVLGRMAKFSDFASIVVPGTMLSYNSAYETGREIYGDDAMKATTYAAASSLITGITELIMPDRDILTGGMVDDLAKKYVANYVKKGKRYAVEQSMLQLTEMMGKEVGEEFADRWKDVLLKGVVNLSGGDIANEIPTLNEHLTIAASTAALTGAGGVMGQVNANSKARKLAVYNSAKSYPETMEMLNTMQQEGGNTGRIEQVKSEVTNMFVALKEVPANLSTPKRIAIAEKLNTVKAIENAMASGIAPIIADKMKESIKQIGNDIQAIIEDPEYDKQFAKEVNEEVQTTEPTPQTDVVDQPIDPVANEGAPQTSFIEESIEYARKYLENNIKSEEEYVAERDSKKSSIRKGLEKAFTITDGNSLKEQKEKLALLKSDPLAFFKKKLSEEEAWGKKHPDDINESFINHYKQVIEDFKWVAEQKTAPINIKNSLERPPVVEALPIESTTTEGGLKIGDKIQWNVFGNEESGEWIVGEKTKTRGGQDAVALTKEYIESAIDGETHTKEYADNNGIKYTNEPSIVTHIVPLSDLTTPTAEGTQEAITTTTNEQEVNQEGQGREVLLSPNESAKTEPVSEAEVQPIKRIVNKVIERIEKTFGGKVRMAKNAEEIKAIANEGSKFNFIGENANLPESIKTSFESAKKMDSSKVSSEEIRKKTGWFKGKYDNKWRYESKPVVVNSSNSTQAAQMSTKNKSDVPMLLSDVIAGSEILSLYPELNNVLVVFTDKIGEKANAAYKKDNKTGQVLIAINPKRLLAESNKGRSVGEKFLRMSVAHEVQHIIQSKEGFTRGSSPQEIRNKVDSGSIRTNIDPTKLNESEKSAYVNQLYQLVAGEIESRDVAWRGELTQDQRNQTTPYSSENNNGAIVLGGESDSQMSVSADGKILGATLADGTIVLNEEEINANTPIHEAGHLWQAWAKQNRPDLYKAGLVKVNGSPYMAKVKSNKFYRDQAEKLPQDKRAEFYADEALAMAIGDKGAQFVTQSKKVDFKEWLDQLWSDVSKFFGIEKLSQKELDNLTLDEFTSMVSARILEGDKLESGKKPSATDVKIEAANKRIDDIAKHLKNVLKVDVTPKGTQKSGVDTEAIIDMIAQATKQFVAKGIKTQEALEQVIKSLRDGGYIKGKEITRMRAAAQSELDSELTKRFVEDGKYTIYQDENSAVVVRDVNNKELTGRKRKAALRDYAKKANLNRGKEADLAGVPENDANRFIADNSNNPMQIAQALATVQEKLTEDQLDYTEYQIAEYLPTIATGSFINNNNANNLLTDTDRLDDADAMRLNYLRKNGKSLDVAAMEIEEGAFGQSYGGERITPEMIIDFMFKYPQGKSSFYNQKNPDVRALKDRFEKVTGFPITQEMIEEAKSDGVSEEDFAGNEPAEKEEGGTTAQSKKKKASFPKQVMKSADVSGEFKATITKDIIYYDTLPNVVTRAEANYLIDTLGEDKAMEMVMDTRNPVTDAVRATVGNILLKRFENRGDYDKAINMLEYLTKSATETGRFIQAFAMWGRLTPEGQLRVAMRDVNNQRKDRFEKDSDKIKKAKSQTKKVVKEAIDEALENVKGEKLTDDEERNYGKSNKIVSKKEADEIVKRLREKRKASKNLGFAMMPEQRAANDIADFEDTLKLAVYHIEASARSFAKFSKKMATSLGGDIKPYLKDLYLKAAKESGLEGTESAEEIDAYLGKEKAEYQAKKNDALEKKITAQFERAQKFKSEKDFKKAVGLLMSHPDRETLWKKYRASAVARLKNISVSDVTNDTDTSPPLKDFVDGLVKNIRQQMEESMPESEQGKREEKSAISIIADAFKNLEKYKEVWDQTREDLQEKYADDPDALAKLDMYFGNVMEQPFSKKLVEKSVKQGIKSLDINVAKIAKAHYTEYDATKRTLVDKLMNEADLPQEQAEKLAKAIGDEFDRVLIEKKKALLENLVKEKVIKKKQKVDLETEITKLLNLGAFDDAEFLKAWAKANEYPELTPENLTEIRRLTNEIQKYDDGFEKYRAMEDLLSYQSQIKGVSFGELMTSVWYAHVLSGYNTQLVNFISTAINSVMEYIVATSRNPSQGFFMAKGWFNGIKQGLLEGKEVLKEGYNPIRGKLEIPSTLEIKSKLAKDKIHYAHMAKYVRRVMVASDVIFYEGLREMKAYQLAASMAKGEAKADPSYDTRARAMAILNKSDAELQKFKDIATVEYDQKIKDLDKSGVTGKEYDRLKKRFLRDRSRRVYELIQVRDEKLTEQVADFARRATYNYKPEGILGVAANAINMITQKRPALRFVVPFTNIIANVANEAINYTPLGYIKGLNQGGITRQRENLTNEQKLELKADLLTKATIGTFAMGLALALTYDWDEDDDTPAILEITGNGTGNFGQNYNLQENENWQSYSFRIWNPITKQYSSWVRYQYSPLVVAFSIIGATRDLERFKGDKLKDKGDLALASAIIGMRTFLDMSFLSTIDSFFNVLFNDFDTITMNRLATTTLNIGKGFILPNLYTQAAREIQALYGEEMKETTFKGNDPRTYIYKWIQDIPGVRNLLNDKVNALGDPIIPITNKFISGEFFFDRPTEPIWDVIANKGMVNLRAPSQKTVVAYDPYLMENTPMTDDEFFYFATQRGAYIKLQLQSAINGGKVELKKNRVIDGVLYKKGTTVPEEWILDKDWMSSAQRTASDLAKRDVEQKRLLIENFDRGLF